MAYLVLLITLAGYKLAGFRFCSSHDRWFFALSSQVNRWVGRWPRCAMLITLLTPILIAGGVLKLFEDTLFGLVNLSLQVVILFYAFGRGNLIQQLKSYQRHWQEGDIQSAFHHASEDFRVKCGRFDADDPETTHRLVRTGLIYQWFEQVFVVLFWYLLAGPLAALFVRLVCLYDRCASQQNEGVQTPFQLQHWIEWLPARLLGLTFAIAGNFTLCFKTWAEAVLNWDTHTEEVLHRSGMAALGVCDTGSNPCEMEDKRPGAPMTNEMLKSYAEEIQTVQDLIIRSLVVWIIVLSLLILT